MLYFPLIVLDASHQTDLVDDHNVLNTFSSRDAGKQTHLDCGSGGELLFAIK